MREVQANEGWARPAAPRALKSHYVVAGESLCGLWRCDSQQWLEGDEILRWCRTCDRELEEREGRNYGSATPDRKPAFEPERGRLMELFEPERGRLMELDRHPDAGGSEDAMKELNDAMDRVRQEKAR